MLSCTLACRNGKAGLPLPGSLSRRGSFEDRGFTFVIVNHQTEENFHGAFFVDADRSYLRNRSRSGIGAA